MICRHGELASYIISEQKMDSRVGANLAKQAPTTSPTRDTRHRGGTTIRLQLVDVALITSTIRGNS